MAGYIHIDDIIWTPPRSYYISNADPYCPDCAEGIMAQSRLEADYLPEWEESMDSDTWTYECPAYQGESDSPYHCGSCHRFLGIALTDDGIEYVRQAAMDNVESNGEVSEVGQGWLDYYGFERFFPPD